MDEKVNRFRSEKGFLTTDQLMGLVGVANIILDPFSVLISKGVEIGTSNVFYPNVVIERLGDGELSIGDGNVFYPGMYWLSSNGSIRVGDGNEFGTNGCIVKANYPGAVIEIGSQGRYCDGVSIMGKTSLGDGCQILGAITVQSCTLQGGASYRNSDPDARGAVLKGFGLARELQLATGEVVNGQGAFAMASVERQSSYHPKK